MNLTLAIDCMGGDFGPSVTVPAALDALAIHGSFRAVLVGAQDAIEHELRAAHALGNPRVTVRHASEVVGMDEPPVQAYRRKKDSSMRVAIDLVKSGEADACVSAGNTGALMAISRFVLDMLPGIERPAIMSVLPTMTGSTYMLDLGANVDCAPEHLVQFAQMASILVSAVEHKERPTVGLLNIGEEEIKGTDVVKQAGELLRKSADSGGLNFIGNVEGDGVYKGRADVIVCDGFVGNVALKSAEGVARMLRNIIGEEFRRNLFTRILGLFALPVLGRIRRRVDHREYNGATLIGLRGIVVKSHGSADRFSFRRAIERAADEAENGVLKRISDRMAAVAAANSTTTAGTA